MRKMILSFAMGSLVGMGVAVVSKSLCACKDEMSDLIKTKCQKVKEQMQSSKEAIGTSLQEGLDEVRDALDSLDEEGLTTKAKRVISKAKTALNNLK